MQNAALVGVGETGRHVRDQRHALVPGQHLRFYPLQQTRQRFALEKLHRDERDIAITVEIEHVDDVGMRKTLRLERLVLQSA